MAEEFGDDGGFGDADAAEGEDEAVVLVAVSLLQPLSSIAQ